MVKSLPVRFLPILFFYFLFFFFPAPFSCGFAPLTLGAGTGNPNRIGSSSGLGRKTKWGPFLSLVFLGMEIVSVSVSS